MNIELSSLPGLVYWKDCESKIMASNLSFAKQLGYPEISTLVGKTLKEITWTTEVAAYIAQTDQTVLTCETEITHEEIFKHANGNPITLLTSKRALYNDQRQLIGIICSCHDITLQQAKQTAAEKYRDQAENSNKAKSAFLACMSHDLRTPLNAINGMAQILRTQSLNPEHMDFIDDILVSCQVLKSLIDDILNLSKIESNQLEFNEEPLDLKLLSTEIISQLTFLAEQKDITLLLSYNDEVPRFLMGDSRRLRQIFMNLLGNAIKFTSNGKIILSIELIKIEADWVEIQIAVEDSGIGIPQEKISNVFEKFYQVETDQKREGSGIGLSIVEHLVSKMEGKTHVNSYLGRGSTFWCSLKLRRQIDSNQLSSWKKTSKETLIFIIDHYQPRAEYLQKTIDTNNTIYANSKTIFEMLQKTSKLFILFMIHEDILQEDQDFINKLLNQNLKHKIIIYGNYSKPRIAPHKHISEYISIPIDQSELIGILLNLYHKLHQENTGQLTLTYKTIYKPKILLVEDNPINQKVLTIMLNHRNCDVKTASSGQQAIALTKTNSFNLIFMDIGLPDMHGFEVARHLLSEKYFDNTVPIIALTGYTSEEDKKTCLAAGMREVITKPINDSDLVRILATYLT